MVYPSPHALRRPRPRRPFARLALTATAAALLTGTALAPPAAASGRTIVVGPGANLGAIMSTLTAGDTLRLRPGVYEAGYVRPYVVHAGTPSAPIVVTADTFSSPPVIHGYLRLVNADHWRLSRLRVQATLPSAPALDLTGGTGAEGVAVDGVAVRRTAPSCCCWAGEGATRRPSPTAESPIATIAREEMTIGTTPFLPLVGGD
jgi:hypothetical protein